MPGPFPGMDPYLESPAFWRDVHQSLIYCCRAALNAALPPGFVARIEERLYVLEPARDARPVLPDITLLRRSEPAGGVAVKESVSATVTDAPLLVRTVPEEVREPFIEVVAVNQPGRVVTAIEVLSPANKATGTGRNEYRRKQRDLLQSDTNLLEIDLLRGGAHTVAASAQDVAARRGGPWDYLACLHRDEAGYEYEVWPRTVREQLPRVFVPLTGECGDIALDLQAAFDRAYDEGGFARAVDYRAAPDPPLSPEDAAWTDDLLTEKGAR